MLTRNYYNHCPSCGSCHFRNAWGPDGNAQCVNCGHYYWFSFEPGEYEVPTDEEALLAAETLQQLLDGMPPENKEEFKGTVTIMPDLDGPIRQGGYTDFGFINREGKQ